jgi:XTP/dITP diphosphohydrolase
LSPGRRRFVLASGNPGKAAEIEALLAPRGIEVVAQSAFGLQGAEETATTFVENALLKARHAAAGAGLPAVADDSGLVVDALGGAPGVRSARYAGPGADDADNNRALLAGLAGVPDAARTARFVCVVVLLTRPDDPLPLICQGRWDGLILAAPRGAGGFGYDPLFLPLGEQRTAAELPAAEKNRVSHRARAFAALLEALGAAGAA